MKAEKSNEKAMSKKMVFMAVAIGVLLLVSGVQAYQLSGLKNKLDSGVAALAVKTSPSSAKPSSSLQNNLKNLPQMVGGC